MASDRRVVITGAGGVSPLGRGARKLWETLLSWEERDPGGDSLLLAFESYDRPRNLDVQAAAGLGRCSLLAAEAAIAAVEDARLPVTAETAPLIGVAFGSERGELETPVGGAPATSVARVLGVAGPVLPVGGPASGALALGEGFELVARGAAPVVVAGGADALLLLDRQPLPADPRPAPSAARPFAAGRDGVLPAEGAAAFVLEDADLAEERGARVYGELLGWASLFNRATVMAPAANHVDAVRTMRAALLRSQVFQGEVETVFAAACGDPTIDEVERRALADLWGPNVDRLMVTSVLGAGYAYAAAAPISLLAALLSLEAGLVPAAAGCDRPEDAFEQLDIVLGEARRYRYNTALINAVTPAVNVSIVVRRT